MTIPNAPTGVTVHTEDGDHLANLTYVGVRDHDGLHVWQADTVLPIGGPIRITVDELPPRTVVMLPAKTQPSTTTSTGDNA